MNRSWGGELRWNISHDNMLLSFVISMIMIIFCIVMFTIIATTVIIIDFIVIYIYIRIVMENMMFIVYTTIYDYSATSTLYSLLS